jgi:hypothetical protein
MTVSKTITNHSAGSLSRPSLAEFLTAPLDDVRKVAPITMVLGAGGTRRRAVLEGFSTQSEDYTQWTRQQMMACYELVFQHGIQHLVTTLSVSSHNDEVTPGYREKIVGWIKWAVAGDEALAAYTRLGWRVRLIGVESWPELTSVETQLIDATADHLGPTLWYSVASQPEQTWTRMLQVATEQGITKRAELVRAFYGEEIPPATLYLGSGKPQVEDSQIPLLLVGKLECYWRQHLGYDLDAVTLRKILYDYAYVRPTWRADKTGRAEEVTSHAHAWQNPPVIGMGRRLGPFWYPAPIAPVAEVVD